MEDASLSDRSSASTIDNDEDDLNVSTESSDAFMQMGIALLIAANEMHDAYAAEYDSILDEMEDTVAANVGGSKPGKAPNAPRNFQRAYDILFEQYFRVEPPPTYNERLFERRFRMPRAVFDRIREAITGNGMFTQRQDATGKMGIHPLVRLTAVLRYLSYGIAADAYDENFHIAESTLDKSVKEFCNLMVEIFGAEYLNRKPSADDLARLAAINAERGFPGMFASWDCKHFVWKNCPVGLAGQYQGKEKTPTLILEAICDYDLFIYYSFFGEPGSLNDLNILQKSSIVGSLLTQEMSLDVPRYDLNGTWRDYMYFLVDGIYPTWSIFVKPIHAPVDDKEALFSRKQEAARKDIERAFGVLVQRFHILKHPFQKMRWSDIVTMVNCCIIMHNMISEYRRKVVNQNWYGQDANANNIGEGDDEFVSVFGNAVPVDGDDIEIEHFVQQRLDCFHTRYSDVRYHNELMGDLKEHIWQKYNRL